MFLYNNYYVPLKYIGFLISRVYPFLMRNVLNKNVYFLYVGDILLLWDINMLDNKNRIIKKLFLRSLLKIH